MTVKYRVFPAPGSVQQAAQSYKVYKRRVDSLPFKRGGEYVLGYLETHTSCIYPLTNTLSVAFLKGLGSRLTLDHISHSL